MKKKRARVKNISMFGTASCICGAKIDARFSTLGGCEISVIPKINTFIPTTDKYRKLWEELKEWLDVSGELIYAQDLVVLRKMKDMERDAK